MTPSDQPTRCTRWRIGAVAGAVVAGALCLVILTVVAVIIGIRSSVTDVEWGLFVAWLPLICGCILLESLTAAALGAISGGLGGSIEDPFACAFLGAGIFVGFVVGSNWLFFGAPLNELFGLLGVAFAAGVISGAAGAIRARRRSSGP